MDTEHGHRGMVITPLIEKGFEVLKVNREKMEVEPYNRHEAWRTHATIIARRA